MAMFCGIDWAEDHHDIAVVDDTGALVARARIENSAAGLSALLAMLAECGDTPAGLVPVAIERPNGLLVGCLRGTRPVYPINPLAVSRYRDRHGVAGKKSSSRERSRLLSCWRSHTASCCARASTVMARASSESAGSGRCAAMSVRRMCASTSASPGSDFLPETPCRSR